MFGLGKLIDRLATVNVGKCDSSVTINGQTFRGNSVVITNDAVYIDGEKRTAISDKVIHVTVNGSCDSVETGSGNVSVANQVAGDVKTMSGDVTCGDVAGDVETMSGDVSCRDVAGDIETMSGEVRKVLTLRWLDAVKRFFRRSLPPVVIYDGDSCGGQLWLVDLFDETHHHFWVSVNTPPNAIKHREPPMNVVSMQGFRKGKETTDKYIVALVSKLVAEGHTKIFICSNDGDMVDLVRMVIMLNHIEHDVTFNLITWQSQNWAGHFRDASSYGTDRATINSYRLKIPTDQPKKQKRRFYLRRGRE